MVIYDQKIRSMKSAENYRNCLSLTLFFIYPEKFTQLPYVFKTLFYDFQSENCGRNGIKKVFNFATEFWGCYALQVISFIFPKKFKQLSYRFINPIWGICMKNFFQIYNQKIRSMKSPENYIDLHNYIFFSINSYISF